jgi:nitroimidazol reductase NimA-like FMN-containing flavoprotein (pyridoxamine 5'-phosphate oxidase superfamily)
METQNPHAPTRQDRPALHPGYGIEPADPASMLPWSWAEEHLTAARNYWVGTTSPDGVPHAVPVWGVWLEGQFYFGTNRYSRKGRGLAADPRVVVHLESGDEVVILNGRLEELRHPALFERMADAYEAKYGGFRPVFGKPPENVYYVLLISTALAWRETDFPSSAARFHFD